MPKPKQPRPDGPTFESRLGRLEEIVAKLEAGETGLDESLRLYAEGAELVKACRAALSAAEQKIAKLSETAAGGLKEGPFEPEEEPADEGDEAKA
jgi:exodeoxyribonuclease VII small subunit